MGALEKFVSRWSRLKRASELGNAHAGAVPPAAAIPKVGGGDEADAEQDGTRPLDLTTLPSLESITATTDIRAFLQSAVPVELTRAALRRAWVSDPLIRDFIGIAENQWDFTNPTIPGFGPLPQAADGADRGARAVGALDRSLIRLSAAHSAVATSAAVHAPGSDTRCDAAEETAGAGHSTLAVPTVDQEVSVSAPANSRSEETAMHSRSRDNVGTRRARRAHGGALPR